MWRSVVPSRRRVPLILEHGQSTSDWGLLGSQSATATNGHALCERTPRARDELRTPRATWEANIMRDHCNGTRTNWRVAVSAVLAMAAAAACGGSAAGPGGGDAGPIEPDVSFTVSAQKVLDIHGQDCLLFAASPSH